MLKLILGRQKSGKTKYCLDVLKQLTKNNREVIMLVPEQFSFECQRYLLNSLGPKLFNKIDILSFTGLCSSIQTKVGGFAGIDVDDSTRFILIGQALASVKDNLTLYSKYYNSSAFIKQVMSVITEFKQADITVNDLKMMSSVTENETSRQKLSDLGLILSAYDALLGTRFQEPLDLIERTLNLMPDNSFFAEKTVVIDEFKGFTEVQFKLLERIIAGSTDTYITFCCDSLLVDNDTDIFGNLKKTANRLIRIAKSHDVAVAEPLVLSNSGRFAEDLEHLELTLAEKHCGSFEGKSDSINIIKADSVFSEIDFCMCTIKRLVRENNYRYRDFVIISRDDSYKDIIEETASDYKIPCFTDYRVSVSSLPLSAFIISAIKASLNFNTEDIIKMLKTGLASVSADDAVKLENYAYVWSIDGSKWLKKWTMNQNGFNAVDLSEEKLDKLQKETQDLDKLREKVVFPLERLRKSFNSTAEEICRAVFELFNDYSTIDCLKRFTDVLIKNGSLTDAEYQIAGYDAVIKAFDKIVMSLGNKTLSGQEFYEILSTVLGYETVGEIPQTKDQVIYGTADRIRPLRPKFVFVIGINQDIFPALVDDSGLLSHSERQSMILNNLALSDCGISDCIDEKFLLYSAVTYATEGVFLSYAQTNTQGCALELSIELEAILERFPDISTIHYNGALTVDLLESKEASFKKLAENYLVDNSCVNSLKYFFSDDSEYSHRIDGIERYIGGTAPEISRDSASKIYGEELHLSASKVNDFAGCKFLYFVKYGLGARKKEKVDFNPLTRGNIVHFCLEKFVKNHFEGIGNLNEDDIFNEIVALCDDYIKATVSDIDALDEKFKYMVEVIKDTVFGLAVSLNSEFAQSDFKPKYCELSVGAGEEIQGVEVMTDTGHKITLKGYIDRIDTTPDGKVRVVDYKTGSKGDSFRLSELLNGRDMQMLLYLYSVIKNGQELIKADIPAGVLYFPAKRMINSNDSKYVKMSGIVLDDEQTLKQMEQSLNGEIIPVRKRANSDSYYSTEAMVSEQAFKLIFNYLEVLLQRIGSSVMRGDIEAKPLKVGDHSQCDYCDYRAVCRISPELKARDGVNCKNSDALELIRKELEAEYGN